MTDTLNLILPISPNMDANAAGEAILFYINEKSRWGYTTRDFLRGDFQKIDGLAPLDVRTICCGCWANTPGEGDRVTWWRSDKIGLDLFLYWDGDGTIVIQHSSWMLENSDCKKSNCWEWVDQQHWSRNLPNGYYEDAASAVQVST